METDIVIIGCGPAGLQAGIHSSRKKADTVILGKMHNSALYAAHIENYFGVAGKTDGSDLLKNGLDQALSFGCGYMSQNVLAAVPDGKGFRVTIESGEDIRCKAIILAMGISRAKLNIPGEKEYLGKGVSYCAECDCNFYKGRKVAVIGNESQAAASAELMTKYASEVYWLTEMPSSHDELLKKAVDAGVIIVKDSPKEIKGKEYVETVVLNSGNELSVDGIFIELGGRSSSDIAMDLGIMPEADDSVKTDNKCMTSVEGVFACGDLTGKPWQLAKAVGEGATAGLSAAEYSRGTE